MSPTPERLARFIHHSNLIEQIPELDYRTILRHTNNVVTQKKNRTHVGALAVVMDLGTHKKSFTLAHLKKIHAQITSEQLVLGHTIATRDIGHIRTQPVRIGFGTLPPPKISVVSNFLRQFNTATRRITATNFFNTLAEQHLLFERIHPFADGNGRTGRLLIAYQFFFAQAQKKINTRWKLPIVTSKTREREMYYRSFQFWETEQKDLAIETLAQLLKKSS